MREKQLRLLEVTECQENRTAACSTDKSGFWAGEQEGEEKQNQHLLWSGVTQIALSAALSSSEWWGAINALKHPPGRLQEAQDGEFLSLQYSIGITTVMQKSNVKSNLELQRRNGFELTRKNITFLSLIKNLKNHIADKPLTHC